MNRVINFRFSLFAAVGLCLGIVSAVEITFGNYLFACVCSVLLVAACVTFSVLKSSICRIAITLLVAMAVGAALVGINFAVQNSREVVDEKVTLTGRVSDLGRNGGSSSALYLSDCVLQDGAKLRGKVKVVVYDASSFRTGDVVRVRGNLSSEYVLRNYPRAYNIRNGVNYSLDATDVSKQGKANLTLGEIVRKFVWEACGDKMVNADIAYALLTGDRNAIDSQTVSAFTDAGIVHLLAVSGLHVGVLAGVFLFVAKKLKLSFAWQLVVCLAPLLFYAYVCGFSPSVVRATLMFVCVYVAKLLRGRYDILTSLGWAATIILVACPFYFYDAGFRLSFLSVFGIATLYLAAKRRLDFAKFGKLTAKVADSVVMSVCCTLATTVCVLLVFGKASVAGFVVNLVAVPLVSAAFVLGFVGLIPWVFRYVLFASDVLLEAVKNVADNVSRLSFATVFFAVTSFAVAVTVVWLFGCGGYVGLGKTAKKVFHSVCALCLVAGIAFAYIPPAAQNAVYVSHGYDENVVAVTSADGETAICCNFSTESALSRACDMLYDVKPKSVVWYVTDFKSVNVDFAESFCRNVAPFSAVYVLDPSGNDRAEVWALRKNVKVVHSVPDTTRGKSIKAQNVYDGSLRAVVFSVGELCVANVIGNSSAARNFAVGRSDIDVFVAQGFADFSPSNQTMLAMRQTNNLHCFGANKYGNFTITQKDAKIVLNFR